MLKVFESFACEALAISWRLSLKVPTIVVLSERSLINLKVRVVIVDAHVVVFITVILRFQLLLGMGTARISLLLMTLLHVVN